MAEDLNDQEEPLTPKEADNANPATDKKKKLKKILLILMPLIIAIAGGLYFFFFVINSQKDKHGPEIQHLKEQPKVALESNTYLDIDSITVGLTPSGNKKDYLRLDLALRLSSEKESEAVLAKMPIIKDTLIVFLRSLRATDFNSSSSSIYLKEEITKRINKITAPITVKEVLFQEITVN